MRRMPKIFFFMLTFLLFIGFTVPAEASSPIHATTTQAQIVVPRGSTTDDVIAVGRDADISGEVTDSILVINGTVHLSQTANVGLVVNIGGQVIRDPGANVSEIFTLSFSKPLLNSFAVGAALALGLETARLAFSMVMILLPAIISLIMKDRLTTPISYLEKSIRRVGAVGFLTFVGSIALSFILALTVIGLPVSVLVLLLYVCIGVIGMSALSVWIGKSVFGAVIADKSTWVYSLSGAALMTACVNLPAIGPILFIMLWMTGTGSVAAWLWQYRFRKRGN